MTITALQFQPKYQKIKLPLTKKIILMIEGHVFYKTMKADGGLGYLQVYVVRCLKHGYYCDYPHGYSGTFKCDLCLEEEKNYVMYRLQ